MSDDYHNQKRRHRDDDDTPTAMVWPAPCPDCANLDGLREIAWHHGDRAGKVVVRCVMAACDCALGMARAERTRDPRGRRILGTVRETWDRMASAAEHVAIYIDPSVGQRTVGGVRGSRSEAIARVREMVEGRGMSW